MAARRNDIAQRRAEWNPFGHSHELIDCVPAAGQLEAEHITESIAEQPLREQVLGMIGSARVYDAFDGGLLRQPVGQGGSIAAGGVHAQLQSRQAARRQPTLEWTARQPPNRSHLIDPLGQIASSADCPQGHIRMTGDHLGQALHHQVGAEFERLDDDRRGKRVIDHQEASASMAEPHERRNVSDAKQRVGNRFDNEPSCRLFHCRFNRGQIVDIDKIASDTESRQLLPEKLRRPAVKLVAGKDAVALLEQGQGRRRQRRHAGPANDGPGRRFPRCQLIG
jgi:hypothetical protein